MRLREVAIGLASATALASPVLAQPASSNDALTAPRAQDSYVLGLNIGAQLRDGGIPVDTNALLIGVEDALAKAKSRLSEEQTRDAVTRLKANVESQRQQRLAAVAATNKAQGDVFLKANGAKPEVKTLPSGLQYEVLTKGTGPTPGPGDTVLCNYRGALLDGTEFDDSYKRGAPASLPVTGVIKGWSQALQLMPVGSKWRLYVPSDLAYGEQGAPPAIGPNAVLVFEVELLSIQPKG